MKIFIQSKCKGGIESPIKCSKPKMKFVADFSKFGSDVECYDKMISDIDTVLLSNVSKKHSYIGDAPYVLFTWVNGQNVTVYRGLFSYL